MIQPIEGILAAESSLGGLDPITPGMHGVVGVTFEDMRVIRTIHLIWTNLVVIDEEKCVRKRESVFDPDRFVQLVPGGHEHLVWIV